jgi:hypothetical protein
MTLATTTRGLTHLFYTDRAQINGGTNDLFALLSDAGGFTMGYYSRAAMEQTELWRAARDGMLVPEPYVPGLRLRLADAFEATAPPAGAR